MPCEDPTIGDTLAFPVGNYVNAALGNYVNENLVKLGNYLNADIRRRWQQVIPNDVIGRF